MLVFGNVTKLALAALHLRDVIAAYRRCIHVFVLRRRSLCRLVFELPATGGMIPSSSFRTVKLLRYVNPYDYFVMACEWVFILFTVYYIIEEVGRNDDALCMCRQSAIRY